MDDNIFSALKNLHLGNPAVNSENEKDQDEVSEAPQDPRVGVNDENSDRGNWARKTDYLLSMIGYAVGLGNVWRFPYLAYKNGGGAFLIPYIIMLTFAGLPLFFLECSFGQFASLGPVSLWKSVPILQGVGITMVLVSAIVSIYYNCIIGYSIYYLFASFQNPLPWTDCYDWSNEKCSKQNKDLCKKPVAGGSFEVVNATWLEEHNEICAQENIIPSASLQSPSEQYWDIVALRRSSGLDETGEVVWHLALCLLLAWTIVGVAMFKGIKSSGKVVYFTATFPYAVLLILLIRGVTLDGARQGIEYYIGTQSDISKLHDAEVWKDAATQIFFSLSTAWGGLMALSSYNKFHNNCYWDAIIVCTTNCATSIFAGFAIFSILGHIAYVSNKPVSDVAQSGFGLAFIAYPEALSQLPVSPLWAVLFFFMLITLGLDSMFAFIETIKTTLQDEFPQLRSKGIHVTIALCATCFLLGLPCVTRAGIYWVNFIDHFCAGWAILIAAVLELIGISYIYGGNRFIKDIEMMIGKKQRPFWWFWKACWFVFSPGLLLAVLIWSLVTFTSPSYGTVQYPIWGVVMGWCMIAFILVWIPIVAVVKIVKADGNLCQVSSLTCLNFGDVCFLVYFSDGLCSHTKEKKNLCLMFLLEIFLNVFKLRISTSYIIISLFVFYTSMWTML
ncbi:sodium- and chloride-dependent neutral and basic amino acid transporter B(0+) isoform X1 [Polyodon spathula]|uniref:sodium- and chloride-dependent neutral and basic amino acid transporter B(0+) isoform X1 n=1 Tax=Polyodon spathula TaxID=7913 RepID=UPI001B7DF5BE|nr:sodium- and chloride-dependent neutral and basic amino acid transporter B(0+) isoform X1 [Polyodon spathula]